MTEEEFYALPPERQMALMKQKQQSQAMNVDYGAMQSPYGASPQRSTPPPPQQAPQQEQAMQIRSGGSGGGGMPPVGMISQFTGGGGAAAGGEGAAATSAGGGEGMMAAAGPWAALAAAIAANETYQNKEGNRPEDFGDHAKAMLSGEVLEMDAGEYLGDVPGAEFMASMGNPEGIVKNIGKALKPWDWF
jgi:hypothetical protein